MSVKAWRRRKFREVFPPENVVPEMTPRLHFWGLVTRTRPYLHYLHTEFKKRFPMPGDRFMDFQCDETYEIVGFRQGRLVALVRTGYAEHYGVPPREVIVHREYPQSVFRPDGERAMDRWTVLR